VQRSEEYSNTQKSVHRNCKIGTFFATLRIKKVYAYHYIFTECLSWNIFKQYILKEHRYYRCVIGYFITKKMIRLNNLIIRQVFVICLYFLIFVFNYRMYFYYFFFGLGSYRRLNIDFYFGFVDFFFF